jgi:anti-sigma factor RsiW
MADLTCQELVELVTDYLDGVLPPDLRHKLQTHLAGCDGCTEYVRQISATVRALEAADLQLTPRALASGARSDGPTMAQPAPVPDD